jgi:hypothetical protein
MQAIPSDLAEEIFIEAFVLLLREAPLERAHMVLRSAGVWTEVIFDNPALGSRLKKAMGALIAKRKVGEAKAAAGRTHASGLLIYTGKKPGPERKAGPRGPGGNPPTA